MCITAALRTFKDVNYTGSVNAPRKPMRRARTTEQEASVLTLSSRSGPGVVLLSQAPALTCFLSEMVHFITRVLQSRTTIAAGLLNAECFIIDNGFTYV